MIRKYIVDHSYMTTERREMITTNMDDCTTSLATVCQTKEGSLRRTLQNNRAANEKGQSLLVRDLDVIRYIQVLLQSESLRTKLQQLGNDNLPEEIRKGHLVPNTVRNVIHGMLLVSSYGHRGVAHRRMTVYEWAQRLSVDGDTIIRVRDHKTMDKYGDAKIVLKDKALVDAIEAYVRHVRPLMAKRDEDLAKAPLLISVNGLPLGDDRHGIEWLKETFRALGLSDPVDGDSFKSFSASAIRKAFAQLGKRHEDPRMRELMPRHMCHSAAVLGRHYQPDATGSESREVAGACNAILHGPLVSDDLATVPAIQSEEVSEPVANSEDVSAPSSSSADVQEPIRGKVPKLSRKQLEEFARLYYVNGRLKINWEATKIALKDDRPDFKEAFEPVYRAFGSSFRKFQLAMRRQLKKFISSMQ